MIGSGTKEDPYLISTSEEFFSECFDKLYYEMHYFKLDIDIDLTTLTDHGSYKLMYVDIDGAGHSIKAKISKIIRLSYLNINYNSFYLFGVVRNCNFRNINFDVEYDIENNSDAVGGLFANYTVTNEYYTNGGSNKLENIVFKYDYYCKPKLSLYDISYNIQYIDINNLSIESNIYNSYGDDASVDRNLESMIVVGGTYERVRFKNINNITCKCNIDSIYFVSIIIGLYYTNYASMRNGIVSILDNITINSNYKCAIRCYSDCAINGSFNIVSFDIRSGYLDGTNKINIKAKKVESLKYYNGTYGGEYGYTDYNNTDNINVIADNIDYIYISNAGELNSSINTHSTIIKKLGIDAGKAYNSLIGWYDYDWAGVYLSKDSIVEGQTEIVTSDNREHDWKYKYSFLHFISIDYVDYINLFIGNAWKKILLYAEGDIPFYIDKNTVLYMKFDGSVDENTRDALVYFPTANNIKAGLIIKTIDNNDL